MEEEVDFDDDDPNDPVRGNLRQRLYHHRNRLVMSKSKEMKGVVNKEEMIKDFIDIFTGAWKSSTRPIHEECMKRIDPNHPKSLLRYGHLYLLGTLYKEYSLILSEEMLRERLGIDFTVEQIRIRSENMNTRNQGCYVRKRERFDDFVYGTGKKSSLHRVSLNEKTILQIPVIFGDGRPFSESLTAQEWLAETPPLEV